MPFALGAHGAADQTETQQHHRPCGRLRNCRSRPCADLCIGGQRMLHGTTEVSRQRDTVSVVDVRIEADRKVVEPVAVLNTTVCRHRVVVEADDDEGAKGIVTERLSSQQVCHGQRGGVKAVVEGAYVPIEA